MQVFDDAIREGLKCKGAPPDDFFDEVLDLLNDDTLGTVAPLER